MTDDLRALLLDWLELGEANRPLFPENLYELRERTRAVLREEEDE